jgi:hypothetical protein
VGELPAALPSADAEGPCLIMIGMCVAQRGAEAARLTADGEALARAPGIG